MSDFDGEWREWGRHVITELERLADLGEEMAGRAIETERRISERLLSLHTDLVTLKTQAALWGAIAGLVGSSMVSLLLFKFK